MKNEILKYIKTLSDNEKIQKLLMNTIGFILKNQANIDIFIKQNNDKIIHIRDWMASVIENNEEWKTPRVLTIEALNNTVDKYFEKKNNKIQTIELDETHEKLIADLGEYYVVQMLTPDALDNESKVMQHCIGHGGYDHKLNSENYQYLSLRDKYNKAHVTLEIYKNKVLQLQGKQNKLPETKYLEILLNWLFVNKYDLNLSKYGFVFNKINNKIYSIYDMPDNCEIMGDIDFSLTNKYVKLPNNLKINGNLNLSGIGSYKKLPDNLVVNGNLNISQTKIKELPDNIIINGDLILRESEIIKLPENLIVNGHLNLSGCCDLTKLSENLVVNGNLILSGTYIRELPENLKIGKGLNLSYSSIVSLPDNLVIDGNLDLSYCNNLTKLPENLTVNGDLILRNCMFFDKLPKTLKVNGFLDLQNSSIKKLEDNVNIVGSIDLSNSTIEEINENNFNESLIIFGCDNLKKISNININGNLSLYKIDLQLLENINIKNNLYLHDINILEIKKIDCKEMFVLGDNKIDEIFDINKNSINFEKISPSYGKKYTKKEFIEKINNDEFRKDFRIIK